MDDEAKHRLEAVQKFILRSTVPILVEGEEGKPFPVGTGTLLRINNRYFIITAQHLFEDAAQLEHIAIPDALDSDSYTRVLNLVHSKTNNDDIDVAVVEITSSESIEGIKANWNFLTLDNVDVSASTNSVWVVGYPVSRVSIKGKRLVAEPLTLLTERMGEVPAEALPPVHEGLDIFYTYARSAHLLWKGEAVTPELYGVSGAAIWDVSRQLPTGLWLPERFAKMVAIQSAFMHSGYLRAKSWWAVARSLAKIDTELGEAVHEKTGVTGG
ncbi:MAG: serine protease [Mesorhizobium sp.]|nr:MAG: serine protease [Mesorhizobium sp.]TIM79497.1 MAG: trypsin-like peptidase domain-containing protein [Mesorhizobium sp.]